MKTHVLRSDFEDTAKKTPLSRILRAVICLRGGNAARSSPGPCALPLQGRGWVLTASLGGCWFLLLISGKRRLEFCARGSIFQCFQFSKIPSMAGGGIQGSGLVTRWGSVTDGLGALIQPSPFCDKLLITF